MWKTERERWALWEGDCLAMLAELPDGSVDSIVTDPPYGLNGSKRIDAREVLRAWAAGASVDVGGGGFMGHTWDSWCPGPRVWAECLRVLKPGGHLIAFAGTRTQQWMGIALELGGFEIRDCGAWLYWNGFPKSLDISKAVAGATPEAMQWAGYGTAIKPAHEPWILARKPLDGTVAHNVLTHGVGGLNLDACRFPQGDPMWPGPQHGKSRTHSRRVDSPIYSPMGAQETHQTAGQEIGRYPANAIYCAKPSTREREAGLEHLEPVSGADMVQRKEGSAGTDNPRAGAGRKAKERKNTHPTVKPLRLMAWLVRLVTPPGGLVVDPFFGSGTTGAAAVAQGFRFIGADLGGPDGRYTDIAAGRIEYWERAGLDSVIGFTDNRGKEDA